MSKTIKVLLIILVLLAIVGIAGTAYWLGQRKGEKLAEQKTGEGTESVIPKGWTEEPAPESKPEEGEVVQPKIEVEQFEYQPFTTADQKFSFEYPKTWVKSEIADASSVLPKELVDKYNIKFPALVTYYSATELVQISLMHYEFQSGQTSEQIVSQLLEEARNLGNKVEILNQTINAQNVILEEMVESGNLKLRTKEKILFLEEKEGKKPAYIFSISVLEKDWQKYEPVINHIFESGKLIY